jgi:CelD/BcsL family acetyltransferase involved in cellulose biosynthesis
MSVSEISQATALARVGEVVDAPPGAAEAGVGPAARSDIALSVHDDIAPLADEWRRFEAEADGTVFQTFAWHALWQKHVGARAGVVPAIVVGRRGTRILFLMPLAIEPGRLVRRLVWHAHELCDYNGALLAPDFARGVSPERFVTLFAEITAILRRDPRFRFDAIVLDKLPEAVGGQPNPFLALRTTLNPSGAYLTRLGGDWESFYLDKRSSATRRHDRTKRKRLGNLGEVRYVTPPDNAGIEATLAVLVEQKTKAFARMGVPNVFARPGCRDFFFEFATSPASRELAHVSRLDVGATLAAANFGLMFRGRYYHILASYDDGEVSRFGPGIAHLHELMRHAIEHGCSEFDFTIGDERYKRDWADREVKLYDYRSAVTPIGFAAGLPSLIGVRVKRFIKQTPALWRAVSKARALVGSAKNRGKRAVAAPAEDEAGS